MEIIWNPEKNKTLWETRKNEHPDDSLGHVKA